MSGVQGRKLVCGGGGWGGGWSLGCRLGMFFNRVDFTFTVNHDPDLGDKVHGQADVSLMLAQVADWLEIDLLAFDLNTGFGLDSGSYVLGGDRPVKFAGFTSL